MRHIRLEAFNDDFGNLGLILAGTPKNEMTMADTEGGLIAHDLLEHQNGVKAIGCPADELEAVGALWQVRGRHGDFVQDDPRVGSAWTPEQNVALNLPTIARDAYWNSSWSPYVGQYRTRPHYEDETFRDMLDFARPHVLSEFDGEERDQFPIDCFLDNALHLMRTGYRKAERRFGSGYEGIDTFRAVKEAVKPHARSLQDRYGEHLGFEGQRFRLSYGNGEARCEEIYIEGDY